MKKFDWSSFPRELIGAKGVYMPFPGAYPTRWAIEMSWGRNRREGYTRTWRYLGKPNQTVAAFVNHRLREARLHPQIRIHAWEFVRNGAIAFSHAYGPSSTLPVRDWNHNLFRLVDPWVGQVNCALISHWANGQMRPLPLIHKGKRFVIYSPGEMDSERLAQYGQWLNSVNISI